MSHFNSLVYKRATQSRAFNVAPHFSLMSMGFKETAYDVKPSVWKALGVLGEGRVPKPWTTIGGSVMLAKYLYEYGQMLRTDATPATKIACIAGELVATWSDDKKLPNEHEILTCRAIIEQRIRSTVLPGAKMQEIITALLKDYGRDFGQDMSAEEARRILALPENVRIADPISTQKVKWFEVRGNLVRKEWFSRPDDIEVFLITMADLRNGAGANVPNADATIDVENWPNHWAQLTDWERLGIIELWSSVCETEKRSTFVQATYIGLIGLLKNTAITEEWLAKRLGQLSTEAPNLNLDQLIDTSYIEEFGRRFPKDGVSNDDLYKILLLTYSALDQDKLYPIKWSIEQGIVHNIASAVSFAEAVIRPSYVPLDKIMAMLPINEFQKLMELVMHLKYDRFAATVRPPITMSEYADLAYIGNYIVFADRGKKTSRYAGAPLAYARKTERELKRIADTMLELTEKMIDEGMSAVTIANDLYPDDVVIEIGDGLVKYPRVSAEEGMSEEERVMDREARQKIAKASWGIGGRSLPKDAQKLTHHELVEELKRNESPRAKAFRKFMADLLDISSQQQTEIIPAEQISVVQRRRKLTHADVQHLNSWRVQIPPEYMEQPPPIPVENMDRGSDTIYFVPVRFDPNVLPHDPAPADPPAPGNPPPAVPPPAAPAPPPASPPPVDPNDVGAVIANLAGPASRGPSPVPDPNLVEL